MPANCCFLCGWVPYTSFLCYGGRCTLTMLMFQVWTWMFHFPRRRMDVYPPYLRYLFCNSAVAASRYVAWVVAAAARSVAVTNCTLLAVSELQFRWDAIELHSSVLIMRIMRLCEFAGDDIQVSLVHVLGAGPHFSQNSSISGWFNRARQQSR